MAKRALLIGCNYPGTEAELSGCVNDVIRMYRCLLDTYEFKEEEVFVMVDIDPAFPQPTGQNIREALAIFCQSAEPGDTLFFHFSGHGIRLPCEPGSNDNTGFDECIVPSDGNLITDDDFRAFVDMVPQGCRITIVSDSCHSGGLIDGAKEQIGESTKPTERVRVRDLLRKKVSTKVNSSLEKRGIHLPLDKLHRRRHENVVNVTETPAEVKRGITNRSMPISILIQMLRRKTGKTDITEGNLKTSLFEIFGDNMSPKIKQTMKYIVDRIQGRLNGGSGGNHKLLGAVGKLAMDFAKLKMEQQANASGASNVIRHDKGILISGCQTDQTSADRSVSGDPADSHGALSNAIQIIIAETNGKVTNQELVMRAREILESQGLTQRPGLYCSDSHVTAPFLC
ncbi:hypothetical protein ACHQM5_006509 [Ranunculus cassubicifolius]